MFYPYNYFFCVVVSWYYRMSYKAWQDSQVLSPPFWSWEIETPVFLLLSDRPGTTQMYWTQRSFFYPARSLSCGYFTAGDLLVVCVLCAYGTLHIRFLGVDDNYYCVCLVFIFPFIGTYFLNFSNQCYYWTDISKVVFIAHLDWKH